MGRAFGLIVFVVLCQACGHSARNQHSIAKVAGCYQLTDVAGGPLSAFFASPILLDTIVRADDPAELRVMPGAYPLRNVGTDAYKIARDSAAKQGIIRTFTSVWELVAPDSVALYRNNGFSGSEARIKVSKAGVSGIFGPTTDAVPSPRVAPVRTAITGNRVTCPPA